MGPTPSYPLPRSATSARWPCAFLNHQLQLWSCCEAMHRGTGVSAFVFIFDCLFLFLSNLSPSNMVSDGMEHCLYVIVPALICQSSSVAFQTNRAFRAYVRFITVTAYGLPSLSLWIINDSHSLRISHVTLWNICFAFFLFCFVISIPAKFVKATVSSIAAHIRADSLTFTHSCC